MIYKPVDKNNDKEISFEIEKGESVKNISKELKEKNLIKNKTAFYYYVKKQKTGQDIIAGHFTLKQNMNSAEITQTLTQKTKSSSTITIQEGLTIKDIDSKLANKGLIKTGEFNNTVKDFSNWDKYNFLDKEKMKNLEYPLEGYLYPDTYFLDPSNFNNEDFISIMLNNFEKKITNINEELNNNKHSFHEIITMASIIENEVFGKEDRSIVSGILWKRLKNNWPIGADITLIYITKNRKITYEDLQLDSPYNTRKNLGLPPGPISNPSIESINAALEPKESEYWFYLTTIDTGKVIYSKSNEEHNMNRAKFL